MEPSKSEAEPVWLASSTKAWSENVAERLKERAASCSLGAKVRNYALENPEWFYHPAIDRLKYQTTPNTWLQAAAWIGACTDEFNHTFNLTSPVSIYTPAGTETLPSGSHSIKDFIKERQSSQTIGIDIWGLTVGKIYQRTAASYGESLDKEELFDKLKKCERMICRLKDFLPKCYEWVQSATKIIVPQIQQSDGRVRSTSRIEHQGVVFLDLSSELNFLESLVHESAHQHFFLAEYEEQLVKPEQQSNNLYYSPLRKQMRPLRGVFLAYHALVFINLFLQEWLDVNATERKFVERAILNTKKALDETRISMTEGIQNLSPAGLLLFQRLRKLH